MKKLITFFTLLTLLQVNASEIYFLYYDEDDDFDEDFYIEIEEGELFNATLREYEMGNFIIYEEDEDEDDDEILYDVYRNQT